MAHDLDPVELLNAPLKAYEDGFRAGQIAALKWTLQWPRRVLRRWDLVDAALARLEAGKPLEEGDA